MDAIRVPPVPTGRPRVVADPLSVDLIAALLHRRRDLAGARATPARR